MLLVRLGHARVSRCVLVLVGVLGVRVPTGCVVIVAVAVEVVTGMYTCDH